jgi:hypothetical protein
MLNDERELRHMLLYSPGSGKKVPFNFAQQLAERQNSMLMHELSLYALRLIIIVYRRGGWIFFST